MVTVEELVVAVHVVRAGRGEPAGVARHRRDPVQHAVATTAATATNTAATAARSGARVVGQATAAAGDHGEELGSV